jgi:hypothetical protein
MITNLLSNIRLTGKLAKIIKSRCFNEEIGGLMDGGINHLARAAGVTL